MVAPAPLVEKLNPEEKPTLPLPVPPVIAFVATILPAVEKLAPTLIPLLPEPLPPTQLEKVTVPEVPVVIAYAIDTP